MAQRAEGDVKSVKKPLTPADKRKLVRVVLEKLPISERRTCKLIELDRSTHRYRSKGRNDMLLRERIKALAVDHRRYGSPRLV